MRIGVAIILLVDLFVRSLSINAFFTNEGLLPLETLKLYNWNQFYFSYHALNGELWFQVLLFILNAVCIIVLLIGYRARLFTFICWTFLVSVQNRNPLIAQSGDDLLRLLLLWGVFLPWGERYSLVKKSAIKTQYFSIANMGYLLLVASVCFFSALLKTSPEWRTEGTAIYYALSIDQLRLPFGSLIYEYPQLLKFLTHLVFGIELIAPLLLIMPFVSRKVRILGIVMYVMLFIGISVSMYVGLFYIIGIVSIVGLLPSKAIDYFERHFYKNRTLFIREVHPVTNNFMESFNFMRSLFVVAIIVFCLLFNLTMVQKFPFAMEPEVSKYGSILRLEQNWGMFSPSVFKDDGYYVFSGYSVSQKKFIDVKHDIDSVSFEKPKYVVCEYESDRWRKYFENYIFTGNNYIRPYFCSYYIKKWNREHPENQLSELIIYYMKEVSLPNYQTEPIKREVLCNCQN